MLTGTPHAAARDRMEHLKAHPDCRIVEGPPVRDVDLEIPGAPLYAHQATLPPLPVPDLGDTCALYLESVRPLCSDEDFRRTKAAVERFCEPGGLGRELQRRLMERARSARGTSWLAAWWNHYAYLAYREPVPINVSYFFHFADHPDPRVMDPQAARAADLAMRMCAFRDAWKRGAIAQEVVGRNKTPLCSAAYKYLFNSCRVPARGTDVYALYDPLEHHHIVVFHRGLPFKIETVTASGEPLGASALEAHFQAILDRRAAPEDAEAPVGTLTSWHRDRWAQARARMLRHPRNRQALHAIESAAFVLCLDDARPSTLAEIGKGLLHGDGRNRWFDKSLQLIVFANGKAGLLGEHAMMDGMPVSRAVAEVVHDSHVRTPRRGSRAVGLPPTPLRFASDARLRGDVAAAAAAVDGLIGAHDLYAEAFHGYGTRAIKGWKMSPDAFVQMAIQLAYRRMSGHFAPTYEATQTRRYRHGRTACTRSCSSASRAWVESMLEGAPNEQRIRLLRLAASQHTKYARRAGMGMDADRHLFGLRRELREGDGERAALFDDPMFRRSQEWEVSTSTLVHELYDGWGFGPVVPHGVGVAYMVKERSVHFNVTSRRSKADGSPQLMCHHLSTALLEMRALCEWDAAQREGKGGRGAMRPRF